MGKLKPETSRRALYSRAAIAPAKRLGMLVADSRAHGRTSLLVKASRRPILGAAVVVIVALAYPYTLATLVQAPNAALIFLVVAAVAAFTTRPSTIPDIHDSYTDCIVGVPTLAVAVGILLYAPSQASVFTWAWRLDLLSLPFFAAGAIALALGVRALWAQRGTIVLLILPWLLTITGLAGSVVLIIAAGVAIAGIGARLSLSLVRGVGRPPMARGTPRSGTAMSIAMGLLLGIALFTAVKDAELQRFQALFTVSGQPRVSDADVIRPIAGWTEQPVTEYPWIQHYVSPDASWRRYSYPSIDAPGSVLTVDVMSVANLSNLTGHRLDEFFRLQGARLLSQKTFKLRDGVDAQLASYAGGARSADWRALFWDWPVSSRSGVRYQRIVISRAGSQPADDAVLVAFANRLIDAAVSGAVR